MIPEIVHWRALEQSKEEENETNGSGQGYSSVKNVGVDAIDSDAKEGDDNRDFGDDAGQNIEKLCYPPTL